MFRSVVFSIILTVLLITGEVGHASNVTAPVDCQLRYSVTPDTVRVVLDCPWEVPITDLSTTTAAMVSLATPLDLPRCSISIDDAIVTDVTLAPDLFGQMMLTVSLAKARKCRVFTVPAEDHKPFRVVIDILKQFETRDSSDLSPAISYTHWEKQTDTRYFAVHLLDVNLTDPHVRLDVVAAQGERERVSAMVQRTSAVAGVNGGYFTDGTRPVGLLKVAGQVLALPIWSRTALAVPTTGNPVFLNPLGVWRLTLPDGSHRDILDPLDASVRTPAPDSQLYAGATYQRAPAIPHGLNLLLRGGVVVARNAEAMPIAPGEYLLQVRNADFATLDPLLPVGATVTVAPVLTPDLSGYAAAVGAGPRLVSHGDIAITGVTERFKPDILTACPARTAVGLTAAHHLLVVAVEAPCAWGGGMTLEELAMLLHTCGASEAMNLDGGGSTTMVVGGDTVTCRPGAWVRPVASGVLIYDDRVTSK